MKGRSREWPPLLRGANGLQSRAFALTIAPMFKRIALPFLTLLLALVAAPAAHAQTIEGTWDFRVAGVTIFRFEIEEGTDGEWLGQWHRPESFNTDGNNFANLDGGVKSDPSMTGIEFLGQVELSFDDPRPGAVPDIFRFDLTSADTATMLYVGTDLAPYMLVRARDGDPIGDWDGTRIYRRRLPQPDVEEPDQGIDTIAPITSGVSTGSGGITFIQVNPVAPSDEPTAGDVAEAPLPEDQAGESEAAEEVGDEQAGESPSLIGDDFLDGL